ncbi:MAG: haloacid dehalogenase [Candidatus Helarchaeota archaeon]
MIEDLIQGIRTRLDASDTAREKVLILSRKSIRLSSETIKYIHRRKFESAKEKLRENQLIVEEIRRLYKEDYPEVYYKGYVTSCQQEFMESFFVYKFIKDEPILRKNIEDLQVEDLSVLLGLADVVGELRRYILDSIRHDDFSEIEKYLLLMDEIFQTLSSLDYPKAMIPGLRKKCDVARSIIERTRGDVTMALQLKKFNNNIKK